MSTESFPSQTSHPEGLQSEGEGPGKGPTLPDRPVERTVGEPPHPEPYEEWADSDPEWVPDPVAAPDPLVRALLLERFAGPVIKEYRPPRDLFTEEEAEVAALAETLRRRTLAAKAKLAAERRARQKQAADRALWLRKANP